MLLLLFFGVGVAIVVGDVPDADSVAIGVAGVVGLAVVVGVVVVVAIVVIVVIVVVGVVS